MLCNYGRSVVYELYAMLRTLLASRFLYIGTYHPERFGIRLGDVRGLGPICP